MISCVAFDHGWYYHYRLHNQKVETINHDKLISLYHFLKNMQEICPHEFFKTGMRGSKLAKTINIQKTDEQNHEVSLLTKEAINWSQYKTAHSNVECFMLNFDTKTLAVEVPVWFLPGEMPEYENQTPLTGHIDILRFEDNKIWVLDYKPKAHKEKYATAQTYFYSLMLSKRTGIPLDRFMCGYFDEKDAYFFEPSKVIL